MENKKKYEKMNIEDSIIVSAPVDFEVLPNIEMTDKVKRMIDLAKKFKEKMIRPSEDLIAEFRKIGIVFSRVKVYLPKEVITNSTREELQKLLNKYIEAGFLPSDTTPDDVFDESVLYKRM
jgi:DNA primase large subunit